jgi:hypothetical protein
MSTIQKDDLLSKIQGLLAKAESTEFEGERAVFMAKADELMMKYNVELWELAQHDAGRIDGRTPIIHDFDYSFAFESGPFPEISDALWSLFLDVARHANCVIVIHKQHYSHTRRTWESCKVPVIGTEADLGYMTLLFSSLMTQLVESTHPKADPLKSMFDNLVLFREAGIGWDETGEAMQAAGFNTDMERTKARDSMLRYYRKECKVRGVPQNYNHWKTFRRNFSAGFAAEVGQRLHAMRNESVKSVGSGLEIALRDQVKINREFMYAEFPISGATRGGTVVRASRKIDMGARTAGSSAGAKANISVNPSKGVRSSGKSLNK